jgi:hypothetical protein
LFAFHFEATDSFEQRDLNLCLSQNCHLQIWIKLGCSKPFSFTTYKPIVCMLVVLMIWKFMHITLLQS